MSSFDDLDNIFNDVIEEIATQEVTVESDKTWMFYITMSDSYTRRDLRPDDDIILKQIRKLFRIANYPCELIYSDEVTEYPEFAFDIPKRTSFKFLVKFYELVEKMPLYLYNNHEYEDVKEIKTMTLSRFVTYLTDPATPVEYILRRMINLEKRQISIYYENKEIERLKKRMCWKMDYAFDCDISTDYIQIKPFKDERERLNKTTYWNLRDDSNSWFHTQDKSTIVKLSDFDSKGWYLCRVLCGSRWTFGHTHQVHYLILVFKSFNTSDVYWFVKDSSDLDRSKFWVEYRRRILTEFVGKTDAEPIYREIEYKEFKDGVYKNRHQNNKLMRMRY